MDNRAGQVYYRIDCRLCCRLTLCQSASLSDDALGWLGGESWAWRSLSCKNVQVDYSPRYNGKNMLVLTFLNLHTP